MSNQEDDFGILKGTINEPYANFCSTLMRDEFNMVGIYYHKSDQTSIYLFRSFDGTSINYFSSGITLEMLASHHLITRLVLYPFDIKTWSITHLDQSSNSLFDRFLRAFSRSLMSSDYTQNYAVTLNRYFNSDTKEPIPNGYYRINDIILITCGLDTLNRWGSIDRDIIECKYLQSEKELDCTPAIKYHDPLPEKVKIDSIEKLTSVSREFINLVVDPWLTQILGSPVSGSSSEAKSMYIFPSPKRKSKVDDSEILEYLRQSLNDMFNPEIEVCSVHLSEIQNAFNLLATKHSIEPLNFSSEYLNDRSIILSYSDNISIESPLQVPLKCGNTVIISTSGCKLDRFSSDELAEILRYCLSVRNAHPSQKGSERPSGLPSGYVNIIIDTIVTELASRK